ncbi:nitrate regulatory gene2 protein-like [Zingiber officinale]|uniref:nitrate regulatory gene2 protein-like n=1 Tax=Zingiber officinale TaxID=94328 RepID=UPI001C4D8C4F|nr:nitrate regulatory gene2 protein-like [Zingiber officinale]
MGCNSSKVEKSDLVFLCRERRDLIAAAVDRRYDLAAAHAAYFDALSSVGDALHRFVQEGLTVASSSLPPDSPLLTVPSPVVKGKIKSSSVRRGPPAAAVSSYATTLTHALSPDGSHLPLSSVADSQADHDRISEPDGGGGDHGKDESSTPHQHISSSSPNSSFLKSSVEMPQTIYQEPFPQPRSDSLNNGYEYGYFYPPYGVTVAPGTPAADEKSGPSAPMVAPPTPPPPSPAKTSGWEFLDPFASYEHFLPNYSLGKLHTGFFTSSPDLGEVRKQEGIPDLEFELDAEPKKRVMKENTELKKNAIDKGLGVKESSAGKMEAVSAKNAKTKDEKTDAIWLAEKGRMNSGAFNNGKNGEAKDRKKGMEAFDKKSYASEESEPSCGKSLISSSSEQSFFLHSTRDLIDVVKEIREHFNSAADCGEEVSRMLEADKFPYHSRSGRFGDISFRILDQTAVPFLTSSLSFKPPQDANTSTMKGKTGKNNLADDVIMNSRNLSSTLEKLYLLEEKLYKEIKEEEKLRIIYEKRYKQLKALSDSGADSSKIEMTQISVRKLETEISVIVRSINSISNRMHKIRDEELQPLLTELVRGLLRMWQSVLNCHQKQLKVIVNSKIHKLVSRTGSQRESVSKATKELQLELINWYQCFIDWIFVQKSYIDALNGWLISWLPQEVEQTSDGVAPFSPSRIGAPSVFVLSNDWYHANKHISGKQVIEAMDTFIRILHNLLRTQKEEEHHRLEAEYLSQVYDKNLVNFMEKGTAGHLEIESVSENGLPHRDDGIVKLNFLRKRLDEKIHKHKESLNQIKKVSSSTLQSGLTPLFEALGSFTSDILREYDSVRIPTEGGEMQDKCKSRFS